jgi:uncharacterized protein with ParB-like and HNH nuclease domain
MLKLKDIRKPLPFRSNKNNTLENIKDIVRNHYGDVWDFDVYLPTKGKNLQRPLVWTLFQKQQAVISILKEIHFTPLSIIQYKEEAGASRKIIYKVIDGKQRLTSILGFYKGEFPIEFEGKEYFFNDLDEEGKRAISLFSFTAEIAYEYADEPISDDDKIAWFEKINFSGTPQDEEHLKNLKS